MSPATQAALATEDGTDVAALTAPPAAMFQGYDSVSGAGRSTAVEGETNIVGGTSGVSYEVCENITKLAQTLNISQSLSVSYGPGSSVDQKMEFVRTLEVTTYSISIVVTARHVHGTETKETVTLKSGITPPSTPAEMQDFVRVYGDTFVTSQIRGGEYYAVYTFYSETREERETLIVDLKAKGLWSGASVNASLQTKLDTFTSSTNIRSALKQSISGIQNPTFPDANNIISYALGFPSRSLDAPAIINFVSEGYEHVAGFGKFEPIYSNRLYFIGSDSIGGLTASLVAIQELRDQILWLQGTYAHYQYNEDKALADAAALTQKDIAAIDAQMQAWDTDATQKFNPPDLPSLKLGTPSLKYTVGYGPTFGGNGGKPIDDFNPHTYIRGRTRLVKVQLQCDKFVDALIVTYDGDQSKEFHHGGNGGRLGTALYPGPDQYVTKISGSGGWYIDYLDIEITGGNHVGGGGGGGGRFEWSVPTGSIALGFGGLADKYLDQIQIIYATFAPASWQPTGI